MSSFDVHEESDGNKGRRSLWMTIALLAVIMLGGGAVFVLGVDDTDDADAVDPASRAADAGGAGDDDTSTDWCAEFPDAPDDFPSDPPDVDWAKVESVAYPTSDTAGPVPDDPTCFAPTPTGALLAATSGVAHIATPSSGRAAYLQTALIGPGRGPVISEQPDMGDVRSARVAGYKAAPRSCSADRCRLEVIVQLNAGDTRVMMHQRFDVRRRDGTWRMHVPADGFPDGSVTDKAAARSDGFVLW